jgi:OOP family OmpA-OmpF porin
LLIRYDSSYKFNICHCVGEFIATFARILKKLSNKATHMKKVTLLLLGFAFTLATSAQDSNSGDSTKTEKKEETRKFRSWSIGGDFGWSMLLGDFHFLEANKQDFNDEFGNFDPGFTVNLQKWYSSAWGWRGRAGWLSYSGSNGIYASQTKSAFRGEFGIQLNLSGIGQRNRYAERKDAWIVNVGFGYTWANTIVFKNGEEYLKLGSDQYPQFINDEAKAEKSHNEVYMPFGLEWRYRFAERWDLKIAIDAMWAMSDNFDGSETTVKEDWNINGQPPTPEILELAFGNTTNDFLVYFNVGVNYHFSWFKPHEDPTPIIYMGPGVDPRVDKLVKDVGTLMGDADNDGVSDYFDKEPETPEGYMVYGGGQAVDQDQDGVPDNIDEDPYSTKGCQVDERGRELDGDGDGVADCADLEPNSKTGAFVNYQGVTIVDRIGGGGSSNEAFLPNLYFDFNKSNVTTANYQRLVTIARFLEANPNANLRVIGHTDKVGTESYNNGLSERRAKAAKKALVEDFGIDESRLEVVSKGKSQLISKRDDINRRVMFEVKN